MSSSAEIEPLDASYLTEPNLEDVKRQLGIYEGGRIKLTKDEDSGVAYLCIDHAEKKNCFSGKMMVDFNDAVAELEKWETGKGLILYSSGDLFCSGSFLNVVKQLTDDPNHGYRASCLMHDSVQRLRNLPLVSVAIVQGKSIGGGGEIMLSTDFRLFTQNTLVAYVQAKMGITTAWGAGMFLKQKVGHSKALDYILTGRKILTEEALAVGLADGIVNHETRLDDALTWLNARIQHLPTSLVRAQKRNILATSFLEERQVLGSLWGRPSHLNALNQNYKHY
ncbi:unnamed protein product [Allacma fusca]|uniref:Ethylmalonyl-CoA decarboxylase n=1 Tax=Allacma fusca TaxID=39272 RepID=A0A8J2LUT5_9HEXA|nr:unnamed protein product [Allacma fusca]